jgi:hypothetical protein
MYATTTNRNEMEQSMRVMTKLFGIAMALAAFTVTGHAQTVVFNAIGSSAQFLEAGLAAGSATTASPAGLGATCVWSKSSANTGAVEATDPTTSQAESGNAWIAWTPGTGGTCATPATNSQIYAFLQTDSTVGVRCYFNKCTMGAATSPAGTSSDGLIFGTSGEVALSSTVWNKLNSLAVNVAATDIRPEDAAFATLRATTGCGNAIAGSSYLGLGYTSGGTPIKSEYSSSTFHVTSFTFDASSSFAVTPVGAAPIVVFVNPKNTSGFGTSSFTNIARADLAKFLDGTFGKTNDGTTGITGSFPTTVLIREPLSGTYNTMEYAGPNTTTRFTSQDVGLNQVSTQKNCSGTSPLENPLNFESNDDTTANRNRVIGTGQMVSVALNLTNPLNTKTPQTPDTLAYAFWSVGNFAASTSTNAKYLKVDGVDPIETSYVTHGVIPTTTSTFPDVTFSNINNGTYPIWSLLRLVSATPAPAAVSKMAAVEQKFISSTVRPDFVAFTSLTKLHSHFTPPGITYPTSSTPNNGGSCGTEAGGDVGGVIFATGTCTIDQRQ